MKCGDCKHYQSADERSGVCLRQRWVHPEHGETFGLAFAREGSDDPDDLDCDMAERRAPDSGRAPSCAAERDGAAGSGPSEDKAGK